MNKEEIKKYQEKLRNDFELVKKDYFDDKVEFDCIEEVFEEAINSIGKEGE